MRQSLDVTTICKGLGDRQRPVAGPSGALRASKFAPDEFVLAALLAMTSLLLTRLYASPASTLGLSKICATRNGVGFSMRSLSLFRKCAGSGNGARSMVYRDPGWIRRSALSNSLRKLPCVRRQRYCRVADSGCGRKLSAAAAQRYCAYLAPSARSA